MAILFFHPMIRRYRWELFHLLSKEGVDFFFTGEGLFRDERTHVTSEAEELLRQSEEHDLTYYLPREYPLWGKRNFSFSLFAILFSKKYSVFIYSSLTSIPFLLTAVLAKLLGKKIVIFDETWRYPDHKFFYKLLRPYIALLLRYVVDACIAASSRTRFMLEQEFGFSSEMIRTAYNTTPPPVSTQETCSEVRYQKLKDTYELIQEYKKERPLVLYLGRVVRYKGLDLMIHALEGCRDKAFLLVVGSGDHREHCERLVSDKGLLQDVLFLDACESNEVEFYYKIADLFVLPARYDTSSLVSYEAWGFTVNEAMSLGVPVLASDAVASAAEIIKDPASGFLFEAEDLDSLRSELHRALHYKDLKEVGEKGREALMNRCNYPQNVSAFKEVFALLDE